MKKTISELNEAARRLDWIRPRLPKALACLFNWGGLGFGAGGSNGRSSGTSNPTERVASLVADKKLRDHFGAQYAQVVEDLHAIDLATRRIEKAIQSTEVIAGAAGASPAGCFLCAEVRDPATGKAHENGWQPNRERRVRPNDKFGAKVPYCKFHTDWLDRYGCEPAKAIDVWHLEHLGQHVPTQMVRDWHPEEWSTAQSKQRGRMLGRPNLDLRISAP